MSLYPNFDTCGIESSDNGLDTDTRNEIRRIQNIDKDKNCIRLNIELNCLKVEAVLDKCASISIFQETDAKNQPKKLSYNKLTG